MDFDLPSILKALLISTSDALSPQDIQKVFAKYHEEQDADERSDPEPGDEEDGTDSLRVTVPRLVTATRIRETLDALANELEEDDAVYRIVESAQGYRIVVASRYAEWVRLLRDAPKPIKLSNAAMETMAIIAYRQPVTRAEMESIRGVSVDSALNRLLEMELVRVTGRADLPGRPIEYGTTDKFLEYAGVKSIEELPASDIISNQKLDSWIRQVNQEEALSDEDMGLPGDSPNDHFAGEDETMYDAYSDDEPDAGNAADTNDTPATQTRN